MALQLRQRGFENVRPLLGGLDGWAQLAYPVETVVDATRPVAKEVTEAQPSA